VQHEYVFKHIFARVQLLKTKQKNIEGDLIGHEELNIDARVLTTAVELSMSARSTISVRSPGINMP